MGPLQGLEKAQKKTSTLWYRRQLQHTLSPAGIAFHVNRLKVHKTKARDKQAARQRLIILLLWSMEPEKNVIRMGHNICFLMY